MAEDSNGVATLYSGTTRTTDGTLLAYSELRGDQDVSTWIATGDQYIRPYEYTPNQLSGWVRGVWALQSSLLAEGVSRSGAGTLDGQASAIFEREVETSSNFTLDQLPKPVTHIIRQEFVEEKPLLLRSTMWERDKSGTKTLLSDYRILEYKLLPAGTQIVFD